MSEKSALFMARTTRFHEFARSLTTTLGVEVSLATPDSPTAAHDVDLLILDSDGIRSDRIDQIAKWLDDRGGVPMWVIVDDEALGTLRLPNHAHADFVCPTATPNELKARAQRLMGEEETVAGDDVLNIDNLEINLATYQVTLDDEPIDLTLMEYSLLSFLATHPNRAYSREVLLHLRQNTGYMDGCWDFAGSGHVDENETARQAVARECLEELGITVNPADMEFVHLCHRVAGGDGRTYYDLCFVIRKNDGTPAVMEPDKNAGLRWFPTEALPENTSTAVEVMLRPCLRGQPYSEVIHDLPVTSI